MIDTIDWVWHCLVDAEFWERPPTSEAPLRSRIGMRALLPSVVGNCRCSALAAARVGAPQSFLSLVGGARALPSLLARAEGAARGAAMAVGDYQELREAGSLGDGGPLRERGVRAEARERTYPAVGEPTAPLLSVAPMMDWTDIHYRQLARLMTKRTWLYTEMVVDGTVIHSNELDRHLWFPEGQEPVVLQLGGSEPEKLRRATEIASRYGYTELNLNCGCPSDRVAGAGCFGAALMTDPARVGEAVAAMSAASPVPVTVKCRIGVDDVDAYSDLRDFVTRVRDASGCRHFLIHARKAWLSGLNPHQNRTIPPLHHEWVFSLLQDFPDVEFSLNGGVMSCYQAAEALSIQVAGRRLRGVMIGRAAYNNPWQCLADADRVVFGEPNPCPSRRALLQKYCEYGDAVVGRFKESEGGQKYPSVRAVCKPLLGLFHGERGNKRWKQRLDDVLRNDTTVSEAVNFAMEAVPDDVLDAPPGAFVMEDDQACYPLAKEMPAFPSDTDRAAPPRKTRGGKGAGVAGAPTVSAEVPLVLDVSALAGAWEDAAGGEGGEGRAGEVAVETGT